ncbi:MAG: hypothetical protein QXM89_03330 [Candidatus Bathyarchaeia archaeon]
MSVGELIQMSIVITNNGTATAFDISLKDTSSEGFQVVSGVSTTFYSELSPSECRSCNYTVKSIERGDVYASSNYSHV